jgi:hypothetical protein
MNTFSAIALSLAAGAAGAIGAQHLPALLPAAPAIAAPVAPMALPELPTVPAPFTPVVRSELIRVEPTHGHLVEKIMQCQSDACALAVVAETGLPEIEGSVAIWGDTKSIYTAQLEPGGEFIRNPDMNGNGHWDTEDQIMLERLIADQATH